MKAAVWYGREDVQILDLPEPVAAEDQVKIKVCWCGICGSDVHEYRAGPIIIPKKPHPLTGKSSPVILGHEFSGDVVEIGERVKRIAVGDRVTIHSSFIAGHAPIAGRGSTTCASGWLRLGSPGMELSLNPWLSQSIQSSSFPTG